MIINYNKPAFNITTLLLSGGSVMLTAVPDRYRSASGGDYYIRLGQMVCANFGRLPFSKLDADIEADNARCHSWNSRFTAEQENTSDLSKHRSDTIHLEPAECSWSDTFNWEI